MGQNLTRKIIAAHLVEGEMVPGQEVAISIDQTLTHDLQVLGWQQFEAMGLPGGRTELWVNYTDHNMLQTDFRNADDHRYLQSVSAKYGALFSRQGNGICHQVHLERFAAPGKTMVGTDSHTSTAGGMGSLAIGIGGLEAIAATGGGRLYIAMPKVVGVKLTGKLGPWVAAKDVILEVLRRLTVKGGVGKVMEYYGPGVATLSVAQRGTICNMGAELGATSSLFPSDHRTKAFLEAQDRVRSWKPLSADGDATYDEEMEINLSELEPLIAKPHSPENVVNVREVEGIPVNQVCIGSCTNSSYEDLMLVAAVLKGRTIHPHLTLTITPGTKQVYTMIARNGALTDLISAGARLLEASCGPCCGQGQAPATGAVSVRSFNRNFPGRSGTPDAQVYLASPETCAATALSGVITDPRTLGVPIVIETPGRYLVNDNLILPPAQDPESVEVICGPNIKPVPVAQPVQDTLRHRVLIKVGDHITTDHILPSGAHILSLRSNVPAISEFMFTAVDPAFVGRAKEWKGGFVVGGVNYGQGSSRDHAAMAPLHLGVKAIIAKSYARIHYTNLINLGIMPLTFADPCEWENLEMGDELVISGIHEALRAGRTLEVKNQTRNRSFLLTHGFTKRQVELILAGGLLNYITRTKK
ncbi:MAG: aconitate hydratase [Syntrophus sp. (in: bacteria)]|nr:aconitate hydratase [Syntrophus sp. (in: bacteria)]